MPRLKPDLKLRVCGLACCCSSLPLPNILNGIETDRNSSMAARFSLRWVSFRVATVGDAYRAFQLLQSDRETVSGALNTAEPSQPRRYIIGWRPNVHRFAVALCPCRTRPPTHRLLSSIRCAATTGHRCECKLAAQRAVQLDVLHALCGN